MPSSSLFTRTIAPLPEAPKVHAPETGLASGLPSRFASTRRLKGLAVAPANGSSSGHVMLPIAPSRSIAKQAWKICVARRVLGPKRQSTASGSAFAFRRRVRFLSMNDFASAVWALHAWMPA
jgi:hypothetical protein